MMMASLDLLPAIDLGHLYHDEIANVHNAKFLSFKSPINAPPLRAGSD
jgi:hypothetical protein